MVINMTKEEITEKLQSICAVLFKDSEIDSELYEYADFLDDLGMDSITFMTLIIEIENQFQIQIPDDMLLMENFRHMEQIIDNIKSIWTFSAIEKEVTVGEQT